jgi:hypothetical protein
LGLGGARQPEVVTTAAGAGRRRRDEHDVGALEVAVDDARGVGGGERVHQLQRDGRAVERHPAAAGQALAQRLAREQLHGRKSTSAPPRSSSRCVPRSKTRQTLRWVMRRDSSSSRLKAPAPRVAGAAAQRLERHALAQRGVEDLVDLAHPPAGDEAQHLGSAGDERAGREGQLGGTPRAG